MLVLRSRNPIIMLSVIITATWAPNICFSGFFRRIPPLVRDSSPMKMWISTRLKNWWIIPPSKFLVRIWPWCRFRRLLFWLCASHLTLWKNRELNWLALNIYFMLWFASQILAPAWFFKVSMSILRNYRKLLRSLRKNRPKKLKSIKRKTTSSVSVRSSGSRNMA